ncbi:CAP domain-containing protein [Fructilactobacillus fructivorans]|nr:CAP domain-containing protein [Fructilactobacillus fructivorans]MCT0151545.1 hypothetical protein [Fructilactobacillus fructivorans]MCT2867063.1 hypothetical protein [Fructilactobacillus fructivorans]MCT2869365.1 hypothetical protein [Fructilactobacillus fructivorans]MCT2873599.1 hypothetical protein [Fructilactobacillus fructivorans]
MKNAKKKLVIVLLMVGMITVGVSVPFEVKSPMIVSAKQTIHKKADRQVIKQEATPVAYSTAHQSAFDTEYQTKFIALLNRERNARGLKSVHQTKEAQDISNQRIRQVVSNLPSSYGHDNNDSRPYAECIGQVNALKDTSAEDSAYTMLNLYVYNDAQTFDHRPWGHRNILLDPNVSQVGISMKKMPVGGADANVGYAEYNQVTLM